MNISVINPMIAILIIAMTLMIAIVIQTITAKNTVVWPDFRCGNFAERYSFRRVSGESPETMQKLCLSAKCPHQEVRWNYGIFHSDFVLLMACLEWRFRINFQKSRGLIYPQNRPNQTCDNTCGSNSGNYKTAGNYKIIILMIAKMILIMIMIIKILVFFKKLIKTDRTNIVVLREKMRKNF